MKNLFPFEYVEQELKNQDGTKSNFRQVFGLNGVNVVCPKGSYHVVKTADLSTLGQAFLDKGHDVSTFNHRNGESIGLNISFGEKPTKVGDCKYNLLITVPNNGAGKGYFSINQMRLICSNGAISSKTMHKDNFVKIPHTVNYNDSIELMKKSIEHFELLLQVIEQRDEVFNGQKMSETDVIFHLNKWFFDYEMPSTHKGNATFDDFRKALAVDPDSIKCIERYNELKSAFRREKEYNETLNLDLSMYTVYASVTNYLSRRVEKSNSSASREVQIERTSQKLVYFDQL